MNIVLTVNNKKQAMLMHDRPLGFYPSWVEFSRDERGVRIISLDGNEARAAVLMKQEVWDELALVDNILVVLMDGAKPREGYRVPFVNQQYDYT